MSLITRMRRQVCSYWAAPSYSSAGAITYAQPIDLKCRWEDTQIKYTTAQGEEKISRSVVYVGQDLDLGGWLALGTVAALSTEQKNNPALVDGAGRIQNFSKVPNMKAKEFLRKATL